MEISTELIQQNEQYTSYKEVAESQIKSLYVHLKKLFMVT